MNYKNYFFVFVFICLKTLSQSQNINYGSLNLEIPFKYKLISKEKADFSEKLVIKFKPKFKNISKVVKNNYLETMMFMYRNMSCDCVNNLNLRHTTSGFSFLNSEYGDNIELQNLVKNIYDDTFKLNTNILIDSKMAYNVKIKPTVFRRTNHINYFHASFKMTLNVKDINVGESKLTNRVSISDVIIIPVGDFSYQLEIISDEQNYKDTQKYIPQILNSIKINE